MTTRTDIHLDLAARADASLGNHAPKATWMNRVEVMTALEERC